MNRQSATIARGPLVILVVAWIGAAIPISGLGAAERPPGKIAFVAGKFGNRVYSKIWIVLPDGTGLRPLTEHVDNPAEDSPAWSADGSRIAFTAIRNGKSRVYVRDSEGKNEVCLTPDNSVAEDYESPAWSPDGKSIAFCGWPDGRKSSQIFVMGSDGNDKRKLTSSDGYNWCPCWSADGRRIVFETTRDGNREVYTMDADGSNPMNLSRNPRTDHQPACSPDGKKIAFMSGRDLKSAEIFVMDLNGENFVNLTNHPARDSEPTWSPDGNWLAFTRSDDGADDKSMNIFLMRANGTEPVNLTQSRDGEDYWGPSWGRD